MIKTMTGLALLVGSAVSGISALAEDVPGVQLFDHAAMA